MLPHKKPRLVVFVKSMPKGGVDTGSVFTLTSSMAARYDSNPSVLAAIMKELQGRRVDSLEGNVEIRHPKGYVIGIWNGALSNLDPSQSMPDVKPMAKAIVNVKAGVRAGKTVKPYTRNQKDGAAPKAPAFHVSREEAGDTFIDSHHDNFADAKKRMMEIHGEDPDSAPLVDSPPHGILAFPHVDTGKPTLTPAYKRACAACHPDHQAAWADESGEDA